MRKLGLSEVIRIHSEVIYIYVYNGVIILINVSLYEDRR